MLELLLHKTNDLVSNFSAMVCNRLQILCCITNYPFSFTTFISPIHGTRCSCLIAKLVENMSPYQNPGLFPEAL